MVVGMKKVILTAVVVVALGIAALLFEANINGYIADPAIHYSYLTPSPNDRFVFVMLGPKPFFPSANLWRDEQMELSRQIQTKYSSSGLYPNDGSIKPLWEMGQYSWKVFVPSDGIHLARPAPWPSTASDEALSFYEHGKMIRSYRVRDLVDVPWFLPGGHGRFAWAKDINLDDRNGKLIVNTNHFDHYVFDMATGSISSARRPGRVIALALGLAVLSLFVWRRRTRSV
jgi:hypothetical protein